MLASPVNQISQTPVGTTSPADATAVKTADALLVLASRDGSADDVLLTPGRWSVGTADGNKLQIAGENVAARHCLIIATELRTVIRSWDSQTWLNGQPIVDSELKADDELRLGAARFIVRAACSGELIAQLPDIPGDVSRQAEPPRASAENVLQRMDQLCNAVDVLGEEMHGQDASSERLDQLIDTLQKNAAPHVGLADAQSDDTSEPAAEELDGVMRQVDAVVTGDESMLTDLNAKWRQLESYSNSLEVRAAIIEAQASEIEARVTQLDDERRELKSAWSDVSAERESLAQQREEIEHSHKSLRSEREEVEMCREAVEAETAEVRRLYETLIDEFPEKVAGLVNEVADIAVEATGPDVTEPVRDADGPQRIAPESTIEPAADFFEPEVGDVECFSGEASIGVAGHSSSGTSKDCQAAAPTEQFGGLVRPAPYESPFEVSELISERIRCGKLIEELKPGARVHDDENISLGGQAIDAGSTATLAVGAGTTSVVSRNTTTNAMRSRDEAVRQLDELVRAASQSQDSGASLTPGPVESVADDHASLPHAPALPQPADHQDDSDNESSDVFTSDEEPVDIAEEALPSESETESHDPVDETTSEPDPVSLLDRLRQNVESELADTWEADASELPATTAETESQSKPEGDVDVQQPGSLLSSMFGNISDNQDTPDADTVPETEPLSTAIPDSSVSQDSIESADAADEEAGDDEDVNGLRAQLADMFDLPTLSAEKSTDAPSLDERFNSFYAASEADSADTAAEATSDDVTTPTESDGSAESGAVTSDSEPSIQEYMQELLARNRRQDDVPLVEEDKAAEEPPVVDTFVPMDDDEDADRSWLAEGPRHKQDRRQVEADTQKFRELANESARSAVVAANRKQLRTAVMVKTFASCLALLVGAVALLLNLPKIFGFGILGIGLVFTTDLCVTIAKNWRSASGLNRRREDATDFTADEDLDGSDETSLRRRHDDPKPDVDAKVPVDRLARTLQAELKPNADGSDSALSFDGLLDETLGGEPEDGQSA